MSEELYRLVYFSRNAIVGGPDVLAAEIRAILAKSQENNRRVDVTGALLFNAGCFAQVLEGSRAAVEEIFERIQQDERHGDVTLLAFDPVPSRSFENWSMGFVGASIEGAAHFGAIGQGSGFDPSRMTGEALYEALHRLALEKEDLA
jgi:hypothetical protein